jgi:hypothetical protein
MSIGYSTILSDLLPERRKGRKSAEIAKKPLEGNRPRGDSHKSVLGSVRGEAMTETGTKDDALKGIDEGKRLTLRRLALGAAFVVPVVASFSMDGLTISKVHAAAANGSGFVVPTNTTKPPPV